MLVFIPNQNIASSILMHPGIANVPAGSVCHDFLHCRQWGLAANQNPAEVFGSGTRLNRNSTSIGRQIAIQIFEQLLARARVSELIIPHGFNHICIKQFKCIII